MVKNHCLARAVSDVGMYEMRRQLGYKARFRKCLLIIADRFFPSSKLCSQCGAIKQDLTLSDRIYRCVNGCKPIDRDWNAAKNLLNYGGDWIEGDLNWTSEANSQFAVDGVNKANC